MGCRSGASHAARRAELSADATMLMIRNKPGNTRVLEATDGHDYDLNPADFKTLVPAELGDYVCLMLRPVNARRKHRVPKGDGLRYAWQCMIKQIEGALRKLRPFSFYKGQFDAMFGAENVIVG